MLKFVKIQVLIWSRFKVLTSCHIFNTLVTVIQAKIFNLDVKDDGWLNWTKISIWHVNKTVACVSSELPRLSTEQHRWIHYRCSALVKCILTELVKVDRGP